MSRMNLDSCNDDQVSFLLYQWDLGVGVESSAGGSVSYTISEIRQVMVGKKNEQTTPQKWRIIR